MTTTYYNLASYQNAVVIHKGERIPLTEIEVSCGTSCTLAELRQRGPVLLASLARDAMVGAMDALRAEMKHIDHCEHIAVLIRLPLTVHSCDVPARLLTTPCNDCEACKNGDRCESPFMVMDEEGKPKVLPGTVGHYAYALVAFIGSDEPLTCPDAEVVSVDKEPWWMDIPDINEKALMEFPWQSPNGRMMLVDSLMPVRPG